MPTTAGNTAEGFREDWIRESNRSAGSEVTNVHVIGTKPKMTQKMTNVLDSDGRSIYNHSI